MENRSWRCADPSGRTALMKYCMPTLIGRPLKTVVLVTPRPSGTVHSLPDAAFQLAVIAGENDIAQHRDAGGNPAERRVGQQADQWELGLPQLGHGRRRLGHLHEGQNPFLHAGTSGRRHEHDRQAAFDRAVDRAADFLAHHRPHAAAHESEIEDAQRHAPAIHLALTDHDGVLPAGLLLLGLHAIFVGFRIVRPYRQPTPEEAESFFKLYIGK